MTKQRTTLTITAGVVVVIIKTTPLSIKNIFFFNATQNSFPALCVIVSHLF